LDPVAQTAAEVTRILQTPLTETDPALRIRCLTTKAEILREDHPESEHRIWQEVFDLARGMGDTPWQARAQAELSIIEFMEGNPERAAKLLKSALVSAIARADFPTLVIYGSDAGAGLSEMGRGGEALEYCDAALSIAAMVKDMGFPYLAYGCKARALALMGKEAEAQQLLQFVLVETRQLNMRIEQAQALITLGQLAAAKGPRAAIGYFA
jgi:tetratricopeptide (TPR) repeat protein